MSDKEEQRKERKNKKRREQRKALEEQGLCVICGEVKAREGFKTCEACAAWARLYNRTLYRENPRYRERQRKYDADRLKARREAGLCMRCGKNPVHGQTVCEACKARKKMRKIEKKMQEEKA